MKLISWNVNGVRAVVKKGFLDWLEQTHPDILCLQETKAHVDQLTSEILTDHGYHTYWHSGIKKGYSGVAILTKQKPNYVEYGCGIKNIDQEGRIIRADFNNYSVMSLYFPSGSSGDIRQEYKMYFISLMYLMYFLVMG